MCYNNCPAAGSNGTCGKANPKCPNEELSYSEQLIEEMKQWHRLAYPNAAEKVFNTKLKEFVDQYKTEIIEEYESSKT